MNDAAGSPVADYKRVLQKVLETRPSGTRQRLATVLGTNRSFVSQMSNPAYAMPIPSQHIETIFELCHFSAAERLAFRTAYEAAHPERRESGEAGAPTRLITIRVVDFGDTRKNRVLDEMISRIARQLGRFADELE